MRRLVDACGVRDHLTVSMNEITATIRKSARGSGLDDGSAGDIARACGWFAAQGKDGVSLALTCLADLETTRHDISILELVSAGEEAEPARLTPLQHALRGAAASEKSLHGSHAVDAEAWESLQNLARNTYVPATEASRLAGAGAGTSDND